MFCAVYSLAKFYMVNPFVYTTDSCDEREIQRKYASLLAAACKGYRNDTCPFSGRKDCYRRRLSEVRDFGDLMERSQVK